jgi:hypothetical protein
MVGMEEWIREAVVEERGLADSVAIIDGVKAGVVYLTQDWPRL